MSSDEYEGDYSSDESSEDVKSVSGHDSEEDDYVYDWDRSDDWVLFMELKKLDCSSWSFIYNNKF